MDHDEQDMYPELPFSEGPESSMAAEAEAASGAPGLWYPGAVKKFSMLTKGAYAQGYPVGAVVHSTEGRSKKGDQDAENTIEGTGIPHHHCYFCISSTGKTYQSFPLNRWGIHCGQTYHPELGYNLDNKLVGIEVCCAGIVKKQGTIYKPDWNETFSEAEVRYSDKVENVTEPGHYHKFNDVQEQTLLQLLIWLKTNNPSVFKLEYVLGHDEIATTGPKGSAHAKTLGRKQDPGASLSVYMKEYRQKLLAAIPVS